MLDLLEAAKNKVFGNEVENPCAICGNPAAESLGSGLIVCYSCHQSDSYHILIKRGYIDASGKLLAVFQNTPVPQVFHEMNCKMVSKQVLKLFIHADVPLLTNEGDKVWIMDYDEDSDMVSCVGDWIGYCNRSWLKL